MLVSLDFASNTIYHASFSFALHFLISVVITHKFNPTAELVIPTGILTKEAKVEMETNPGTVEVKISKCSI